MRLYAYVMPLCVLLMLLQRVVVLLCCGLSFGIAMPAGKCSASSWPIFIIIGFNSSKELRTL